MMSLLYNVENIFFFLWVHCVVEHQVHVLMLMGNLRKSEITKESSDSINVAFTFLENFCIYKPGMKPHFSHNALPLSV